jgi:hypothetical protein
VPSGLRLGDDDGEAGGVVETRSTAWLIRVRFAGLTGGASAAREQPNAISESAARACHATELTSPMATFSAHTASPPPPS